MLDIVPDFFRRHGIISGCRDSLIYFLRMCNGIIAVGLESIQIFLRQTS